jgi:hypothetical protein
MITYIGLNLDSKKFQVGSTTDFSRRYSQHLKSSDNPAFHRSLQNNPNKFYWFTSVDDGMDSREEEQYYLDFYYGSTWCYNSNPNAEAPPSRKGKTRSSESKFKFGEKQKDLVWVNDGEKALRVHKDEVGGYTPGRGKTYNNGVREKISLTPPGEGWVEGQIESHKICPESRKQFGKDNYKSIPIYLLHADWENEVYYESIGLACKENSLFKSCLRGVLNKKRKQHKGFTARYA